MISWGTITWAAASGKRTDVKPAARSLDGDPWKRRVNPGFTYNAFRPLIGCLMTTGWIRVLHRSQCLVAEDNDAPIGQGLADRGADSGGKRCREIDAGDLGTDRAAYGVATVLLRMSMPPAVRRVACQRIVRVARAAPPCCLMKRMRCPSGFHDNACSLQSIG